MDILKFANLYFKLAQNKDLFKIYPIHGKRVQEIGNQLNVVMLNNSKNVNLTNLLKDALGKLSELFIGKVDGVASYNQVKNIIDGVVNSQEVHNLDDRWKDMIKKPLYFFWKNLIQ